MADAGTIGSFNDFMYATRQRPLSGPEKIANMMTRNRTYLNRVMLSGLTDDIIFQDGTEIVEYVQAKYTPNARNYLPTDDQAPQAENSLQQIKIPWRFTLVDSVWYDHEIELNNGDEKTVFKRLMKVKRQKMFTDLFDKMEDDFFAAPNATTMEGGNTAGADPYSILCFATADGAVPSTTNSHTGTTGTWTTTETLSRTTYTNWANQYSTYDSADIDANLEDALNEMYIKVPVRGPRRQRQDRDGGRDPVQDPDRHQPRGHEGRAADHQEQQRQQQPGDRPGLGAGQGHAQRREVQVPVPARQHRDLPGRQAEVQVPELQPHPAGLPQEAVPAGQDVRGHDRAAHGERGVPRHVAQPRVHEPARAGRSVGRLSRVT
jgi:hypothetical protein